MCACMSDGVAPQALSQVKCHVPGFDAASELSLLAGMAGSGKTTLMQRINSHLYMQKTPGYIINLDPAVANIPYDPNIDIRDTVRLDDVR